MTHLNLFNSYFINLLLLSLLEKLSTFLGLLRLNNFTSKNIVTLSDKLK